ncbi:MAG: hypothetical protein KJP04_01190 [Arenicella sp.]|nr:hypothetical protein [Arenicella sp.]
MDSTTACLASESRHESGKSEFQLHFRAVNAGAGRISISGCSRALDE